MRPWYFAHSVSDYGTPFEKVLVERLERFRVIDNPNQAWHQKGYALMGMDYFMEHVLPDCYGCVFLALPGGHIGAGVASEVEYFLERKMAVFEVIDFERPLIPTVRIEERRILTQLETRGAVKVLRTLGNGGRGYV